MPEFEFKKKEKTEFKQSQEISEKQMTGLVALDNEYDVNAFAYENALSQMSEEEKEAARIKLEEGYNAEMLQAKKDQAVSDREKKNIRKKAAAKSKNTAKRTKAFRQKMNAFMSEQAKSAGYVGNSLTLSGLESLKADKTMSKEKKANLATLKKNAPLLYGRLKSMETMLENMRNAQSGGDTGMLSFLEAEYRETQRQWEEMEHKISQMMPVTLPEESTVQSKLTFHSQNYEVNECLFADLNVEEYRHGKPMTLNEDDCSLTDPINTEIEKNLQKKEFNWERDIQKEFDESNVEKTKLHDVYKKNQKEYDELEKRRRQLTDPEYKRFRELGKIVSDGKEAFRNAEKKAKDLEVEVHVKKQMQQIIDESPEPKPTFADIEKTVNSYLKKVADSAELRFRASPGGVVGILQGRSMCNASDDYNEMVHSMYSPNTQLTVKSNLTFGYLGGGNAKEYVGNGNGGKNDILARYGKVSLRLNKDKMKNRTAFVVGNSYGNYQTERGRSLNHPDILSAGTYLQDTYKRAKEVEQGAKLESAEREAVKNGCGGNYYFECHYLGRISAQEIDEVTLVLDGQKLNMKPEVLREEFKNNQNLKDMYDQVNIVNSHLKDYGREDGNPIKLTVWDNAGNSLSFNDIKSIFG